MKKQSRVVRFIQPPRIGGVFLLLSFMVPLVCHSVFAQEHAARQHWVVTWAAAPQPPRIPTPPGSQPDPSLDHRTLRMIVHTSLGGRQVRVQLSNVFGTAGLKIGAAHIAIREKDSAIVPGSDRVLLFNGKPPVTIPVGALMVSDPITLAVPAQSDLAISIYVPGEVLALTTHFLGLHTSFISKEGDFTARPAIADATTSLSLYWLASVDILAPASARAIVTLGDSITDGTRSTPDENRSWPSVLAQRILSRASTPNTAVANEGIAGNRILNDTVGPEALARFDRDVLGLSGVTALIVLEGINDIQVATRPVNPADPVNADDVIGGLRQIVARAHLHGIRVFGCTLTPYEGALNYTEQGNALREAVNQWIRTSGGFDSVIDFEAAVRDPTDPKKILESYDSGDHLHPNDAEYKAMANTIDLSLFTPHF